MKISNKQLFPFFLLIFYTTQSLAQSKSVAIEAAVSANYGSSTMYSTLSPGFSTRHQPYTGGKLQVQFAQKWGVKMKWLASVAGGYLHHAQKNTLTSSLPLTFPSLPLTGVLNDHSMNLSTYFLLASVQVGYTFWEVPDRFHTDARVGLAGVHIFEKIYDFTTPLSPLVFWSNFDQQTIPQLCFGLTHAWQMGAKHQFQLAATYFMGNQNVSTMDFRYVNATSSETVVAGTVRRKFDSLFVSAGIVWQLDGGAFPKN